MPSAQVLSGPVPNASFESNLGPKIRNCELESYAISLNFLLARLNVLMMVQLAQILAGVNMALRRCGRPILTF